MLPLLPEQVLFEPSQPGGGRRGGGVVEALGLVGGRRGQAQTGRRRPGVMVPPGKTLIMKNTELSLFVNSIFFLKT